MPITGLPALEDVKTRESTASVNGARQHEPAPPQRAQRLKERSTTTYAKMTQEAEEGPRLRTVSSYEAVGARMRTLREQRELPLDTLYDTLRVEMHRDTHGLEKLTLTYLTELENGMPPHPEHIPYLERVLDAAPGELYNAWGYLSPEQTPPIGSRHEWVTVAEATKIIGIVRGPIDAAIKAGKLRIKRVPPLRGRAQVEVLVYRADAEAYKPLPHPRRRNTRN